MQEERRLTWLGHSTVVLELDGMHVVTDPLLTRRVAHLWRSAVPEFDRTVDVVLLSHLHWDHFHLPSLKRLAVGSTAVVPRGSERLVSRAGFASVVGVRSGDKVQIGNVEVAVTHADHASSRRARTRSEAVGYVLHGSRRVYFAGDTDLFDGMRDLREQLDVALLPVAGWGRTAGAGHLDVTKAVSALELLEPRHAVPIHWGTYAPFGLDKLSGPATAAEDFRAEAARRAPQVAVHVLPLGGSLSF
jgi:L-ascorbate metabolism protein UlaG (beta-lactamase superfamily)